MKIAPNIPAVLPTDPPKEERARIQTLEKLGQVYLVAFKTKLKAPKWFRRYCRQASGNARKMWNWIVERYNSKTQEDPSWRYRWQDEKKSFIARERKDYPYFMLTACDAYQEKFRDFDDSLKRYFKDKYDKTKSESRKAGAPTFHKKSWVSGSFRINGLNTSIAMGVKGVHSSKSRHYVRIPNGQNFSPNKEKWVKLCERIPFAPLQVMNVTIIQDGDDFYAAICMKVLKADFMAVHSGNLDCRVIAGGGGDWGVDAKITVATETGSVKIEPFKVPKRQEKHVKRLQKKLSRKANSRAKKNGQRRAKPSKRYLKAQLRLRKAQRKIANKRIDHERKIVSALMRAASAIGVEDTNNMGLMKNHRLAKAIANASPGRFIRCLKWVAEWRDVLFVQADRFYPSTQKCSHCGAVRTGEDKLKLSERTYRCPICGYVAGRDENSARNLMLLARLARGARQPSITSTLGMATPEVMTADLTALLDLLIRDGLATAGALKEAVCNTSAGDRGNLE